jgi:hypothetical protein
MPKKSASTKPRKKTSRSPNPQRCPDDISLYEWESRIAEDLLSRERKIKIKIKDKKR